MDHNSTKQAYLNQAPASGQGAPQPSDPASMRHQYQALCMLVERMNSQRGRLRDIADTVLGEEPPEPVGGNIKANGLPVGGVTSEIVMAFESAGELLHQIDRQIDRIERVSR